MKIAFIALKDLPYIGGIEKYTEEIGKRLAAEGNEVTVFTTGRTCSRVKEYMGMKIVPVRTLQIKGFERFIASRIATIKASFSSVQVIHFHGFENTMLSFLPKLLGKKVIYQGHGLEWERERWSRIVILYFKTINHIVNKFPRFFFTSATVVSNYQRRYYLEKYNNDYVWIPCGVNNTEKLPANLIKKYGLTGNDYIFFAARLVKEKGAHFLIEAYKILRSRIVTDVFLVIAGDAPDEVEYISSLHDIAGIDTKIIFTGAVSGDLLTELYSNAVIFVLPSTIEGMPISLVEAMSFGTPTLSSDIDPNVETTKNGEYGFHFLNRNSVSLADKLGELLQNKNIALQKAVSAQSYVLENFTWDKIYYQFKKLYSSTTRINN